jgi:amino acid adenylation domain-containing protein
MTRLFALFEETARRFPDVTALEVDGRSVSYACLLGLAERAAGALGAAAGATPSVVGLLASRTVPAYAGYLGALCAGAAVVPLNPRFPVRRNRAICAAAQVAAGIADIRGAASAAQVFDRTSAVPLLLTGTGWAAGPRRRAAGDGNDIAYILFTSGSTGEPKGVPIGHQQLTSYLSYCAERYEIGPGSRLSQTFDLTFDPSVFDMFTAWSSGGTVVVPGQQEILTPSRFVRERRITHWFSVPSVISLAQRLRMLTPGAMPRLRCSLFAGEQLTLGQAAAWADAAPRSIVENLYGPTELTVTCTAYRLPADRGSWPRTPNGTVPIGRPYPHLEAVVVTGDGTRGNDGELCVRGPQRFGGYLDPAHNRDRFLAGAQAGVRAAGHAAGIVPRPDDWYRTGDRVRWQDEELVHLGRLDSQLKIHGHRIEPGEIEAVLRQHPGVRDAFVASVSTASRDVVLHALYTGDSGLETQLRTKVRDSLPAFMEPARLTWVAGFPTTANGKTDRARLTQMAEARP